MTQQGGVMRIDNGLIENVSVTNCSSGFFIVSYAVPRPNRMTSIETIQLNVTRNTAIINSRGLPISFCDLRQGMWVDTLFSPVMTRSIPPQSNAFFVAARREPHATLSVTTARIALVDQKNSFIYTGQLNNINSLVRYNVTRQTSILDRNGNPASLRSLRPGQMVRITHASFKTLSIPPQTTAYHIQMI
jgi:hypothetical protein